LIFSTFIFLLLAPAPASSQSGNTQPSSPPSPSPTASPTPTPQPTPVTGLHQWGAVTLFHGLPSDRVLAVAQGPDDAMWFGTDAGLAKLEGRRTQAISHPNLPSGRVLALKTDEDGTLWIGTESGAVLMRDGTFQVLRETAGKVVTAIIAPDRNRIVIATEQGMIYESRKKDDGAFDVRQLLDQPLESADRDHPGLLPLTSLNVVDGKLLAGSLSRGLLTIENGTSKESPLRPPAFFVRALDTDTDGKLWLGARGRKEESELYQGTAPHNLARIDAPTGTVSTIRSGNSEVWVGTDGHGVFRFSGTKKPQRFTFDGTAGGLRSDHVYSIFVDREGVVWFGTDRGVCRFDPQAPRVESIGGSAESNFVRTLYQSTDGRVLAGTNRGLFVYDEAAKTWLTVSELSRNIIYSIAEDQNGKLLIGSASGFFAGNKAEPDTGNESQTFTRLEASTGNVDSVGSIRAITRFRNGIYIASYKRGLEQFEDPRVRMVWPKDSEGSRDVISLFADGDARLLIGTTNDGVFSFNGEGAEADPAFAKLKGSTVRSIARTNESTLWFATNRGVFLCRAGSDCRVAAPDLDARSLVAVKTSNVNGVWCGTTGGGLVQIVVDDQLGVIVAHLDMEQGLPSQNVFAVLPPQTSDRSNTLMIGTSRGIVRYAPGQVAPTLYATRIISKRVHQPSELGSGLNLEYPQNSLLFDVAANSSRTFPEQFQYAFTLSDQKGNVVKQKISRESQFAIEGLKPGSYKVLARAFTKDLVPSNPLSFQLQVAAAPFPWTSTALAVLLSLALLALLWAILERRRIVKTSAALVLANQDLANARLNLANEAERERRRIARDLHDQTLGDLRQLLLLADQFSDGREQSSRKPDAALLRGEIESISQEVRRICEDLSPSVLQNVGFAAALEFALSHAVQHAPPERQFEYEFVCDEMLEERTQLAPNVQMQIYRITQEAVNNICRHANASKVKMVVGVSETGDFSLTIEDNGGDFEQVRGTRPEGRGLANMRARASLIDAEIKWSPREGGGTVFTLTKPGVKPTGAV
ncbi:MAG TPA: two-component regulator propeller domain-containing protein, partial [Pyrinomonadaceae bacterium]|nr:two-component regulator propeller domain-containing protein [Pyrinomonadaceae bacterium]